MGHPSFKKFDRMLILGTSAVPGAQFHLDGVHREDNRPGYGGGASPQNDALPQGQGTGWPIWDYTTTRKSNVPVRR